VFLSASPPVILVTRDTAKGRRERVIPLSDFAAAEIAPCAWRRRGWAFPRMDGRPGPNAPHTVSHLCGEHIRDCGYPDTLHSLRHRFLTLVQQQGRDLRVTQVLAGHASPKTTAAYTLVSGAEALSAVQGLPVPGRLRAAG